jgi:hypothetical protein
MQILNKVNNINKIYIATKGRKAFSKLLGSDQTNKINHAMLK